MSKKRLSTHQGRCGGGASRHNSRYIKNLDERAHINDELTKRNLLFVSIGDQLHRVPSGSKYYQQAQLETYKELFQDYLTEQNKKYHERRQYKRERTIEDLYNSKKTGPMEIILQIGAEGEYEITPEHIKLFEEMTKEYVDQLTHSFPNLKVLGVAIHTDETSLHAHVDVAFVAEKDKVRYPGQDRALEQMGIMPPNPEKPISRYNNRLQTFTREIREKWISIVKKKDPSLDLEVVPKETKRKHLKKLDYEIFSLYEKKKLLEAQIKENQKKLNQQVKAFEYMAESSDLLDDIEVVRTRQKGKSR